MDDNGSQEHEERQQGLIECSKDKEVNIRETIRNLRSEITHNDANLIQVAVHSLVNGFPFKRAVPINKSLHNNNAH